MLPIFIQVIIVPIICIYAVWEISHYIKSPRKQVSKHLHHH